MWKQACEDGSEEKLMRHIKLKLRSLSLSTVPPELYAMVAKPMEDRMETCAKCGRECPSVVFHSQDTKAICNLCFVAAAQAAIMHQWRTGTGLVRNPYGRSFPPDLPPSPTLKPCPMCGSPARMVGQSVFGAECTNEDCGARGRCLGPGIPDGIRRTVDECKRVAALSWNRREQNTQSNDGKRWWQDGFNHGGPWIFYETDQPTQNAHHVTPDVVLACLGRYEHELLEERAKVRTLADGRGMRFWQVGDDVVVSETRPPGAFGPDLLPGYVADKLNETDKKARALVAALYAKTEAVFQRDGKELVAMVFRATNADHVETLREVANEIFYCGRRVAVLVLGPSDGFDAEPVLKDRLQDLVLANVDAVMEILGERVKEPKWRNTPNKGHKED